METAQDQTLVP
ncbi:unnamed protein product, partial [Rotaria sp. Silwood2]